MKSANQTLTLQTLRLRIRVRITARGRLLVNHGCALEITTREIWRNAFFRGGPFVVENSAD